MGTQTHSPARKPLATVLLPFSLYHHLLPCKAGLNHSTCQIGPEQWFILFPHRPALALWRKKPCHGQLWTACPWELFIPKLSVALSQTFSCCDPTQLKDSGRRQSLPHIVAYTDSCQARDCTQNWGEKKSQLGVITLCLQIVVTVIGLCLEADRFS